MREASGLPFLDMLELTAVHLAALGAKRIGMLASPATRRVGVFDRVFAAHGLSPVWTGDEAEMLAIIRAVKAGEPMAPLGPRLRALADAMAGADHWLVACTELSLMTGALEGGPGWTDSLDCLVGRGGGVRLRLSFALAGRDRLAAAVIIEATARFAPEPARLDIFGEQRAGAVFGVRQPVVQHVHDRKAGVEPR